MRLAPLKRPNPYIEEGIEHKPKPSVSPYEKTMERLLNPSKNEIKPVDLKYCKHCTFNIKLSSNGIVPIQESYPLASWACLACSSHICKDCTKSCDRCQRLVCYVCSITLFENNETFTVCPECK